MGSQMAAKSDILINLAAGLFILPFFFISATAGQIADKYEKSMLMRYIKVAEIIIAIMAAFAFYYKNVTGLMFLLFLLGCQAAFFGPVKYSIIPQHLNNKEIVGGNAMVEGGTFLAILIGTISGGLITQMNNGKFWAGIILIAVAVTGWLTSRMIPYAAPDSPGLKLDINPVTQTWKTMKISMEKQSVFLSILGISWFWALGLAYLSQLPNYTRNILHGSEQVVTLLLTMFSIGIGLGSLLCERLSGKKVELGLVPLGSLGLSIFGFDLVFAHLSLPAGQALPVGQQLMGLSAFLGILGSHEGSDGSDDDRHFRGLVHRPPVFDDPDQDKARDQGARDCGQQHHERSFNGRVVSGGRPDDWFIEAVHSPVLSVPRNPESHRGLLHLLHGAGIRYTVYDVGALQDHVPGEEIQPGSRS